MMEFSDTRESVRNDKYELNNAKGRLKISRADHKRSIIKKYAELIEERGKNKGLQAFEIGAYLDDLVREITELSEDN